MLYITLCMLVIAFTLIVIGVSIKWYIRNYYTSAQFVVLLFVIVICSVPKFITKDKDVK